MSLYENPRIATFEINDSEMLIVHAGRSRVDRRVVYHGEADENRYAIVPVNELVEDDDDDGEIVADGTPDLDEMQLVAETVVVPEDGHTMVSLESTAEQIKRMDRKGAYACCGCRLSSRSHFSKWYLSKGPRSSTMLTANIIATRPIAKETATGKTDPDRSEYPESRPKKRLC